MGEAGMGSNIFKLREFKTRENLVETLTKEITNTLTLGIQTKGYASVALSGGATPLKLFKALSLEDIEWEKVRVTLVDDRWVDAQSDKSNEKLLRANLLVDKAANAKFFPLKTEAREAKDAVEELNATLKEEFGTLDVVVLGMGGDAHTASFFPYATELTNALTTDALVCATTATVEPKERITLSRNFLSSSAKLFLHIETQEKHKVFLNATQSTDQRAMPIIAMMQQTKPLMEVYYAD